MIDSTTRCPCGTGDTYGSCCQRYHRQFAQTGALTAPTPEALMRSRFTAFALNLPDYLLATWHPTTRPHSLELDESLRWYRLDILKATGGPFDPQGTVHFAAYYRSAPGTPKSQKVGGLQTEVSQFTREKGVWYYLDGAVE
ncbi:YchJ family protein [Rothia sp. CCM 9417]|uniref:YchJ family protein n=1 Tax=Rothia sp. CCM 9417 TaxID=3402657 RepID=UPI003ADEF06B